MSKSSTGTSAKPLPAKNAWSKGPPLTAPSPRSQSPAPSAQSPSHLTHSRRSSALGQAVPIKDGVSIPRNNVGVAAAKQGSPVTFGSIDDASAPISSSPAAPNPIKESVVKSFGTVPAAPATASSHINGKASVSAGRQGGIAVNSPLTSSSPGPSAPASTSTSAAPSVPATTSSGHKLEKPDIKKLFQSPSAPAATAAETQSPSMRSANLPSQQQSQNPSGSQPQFGSHYTPFVPGRQAGPSSGPNNGPSRSPVYPRQMPNGNGPRSQPPNGGAPGLSSPRLGPPHTPQQATGPQPPAPVPGQVPQQYAAWPGYYPGYDYMGYPQWGYVQPGMPPPPAHPHPQHLAQPPHAPPHGNMPMSPRNPTQHLPSTPTMSHATPNPSHPHPPPPLSHTNSNISSVSSPPPTPSSRLNVNSSTFVPRPATSSKVVLKNSEGKEINLEALKQTAASPATTAPPSSTGSPFRSSPTTPKRTSIRIETEDQRKKRLAEEEEKEKEKQRQQAEIEAKVKKEKEEAERKVKEEEDRKKREEEAEKERIRKEEEERERARKEEEELKIKQEEERKQAEEAEKERIRQEEEARKAKEEEERKKEAERKLKEEEEKKAKEEAERKAAEEAEQKKKEEEEAKVKAADAAPEEGEVMEQNADSQSSEAKKVKESLRIDTSAPTSNAADLGRRRPVPGPLDLSAAKVSRQSSLSTARLIEDINTIKYPEGISSPKPELNENAKPGQFRYDRDFLLQFMGVCKEKPPNLPPLDAIGLEPIDPSALAMSRGGSRGGGHRGPSNLGPSRQASIGSFKGGAASGFNMGSFGTAGTNKLTSEERFNLANRSASGGAAALPPQFNRNQMQRTPSQGGRERTRSKRGEKRPPIEGGKSGFHDRGGSYAQQQQALNLEPVAPLQPSANRWDRKALHNTDADTPELVDRKVKGLLNKLTMEKFDSISDQIITWANKSENEKDGRTLIQVIRLVFEKATDEAAWSEMYARLCRKMMERISPKVQDDGITNAEGKPIAGGQLFRKYLLNRCQEDFERGWVNKEATAAAAASKKIEDDAIHAANEGKDADNEEVALYSEEYYAAQKAKRQGLGLIKFIGELFKLQMLTERIMHECVKKLLGNVENPEEEEIESLCKLLTTVGAILDTPKARAHMDIYFSRMKELTKSPNVSSRMQFMLQDILELRDRKWIARNASAVPTTIAQLHENVAKEKAAATEKDAYRQNTMSRTSSNRGRGRGEFEQQGPDGWAVAGGPPRPPPKAGDLSNFGKIQKSQQMTFGPTSVFSKNKDAKREQPISRSASSSNMFSMLSQQADAAPETKAESQQRKKLVLAPRSVPKEDAPSASNAGSESGSDDEEAAPAAAVDMSDEDAKKKIEEDLKELFAVRNVDEAESYFTALPSKHHHSLIDKVVSKAVESKAADAELVANFFERAVSKELTSASAFESGFEGIAEFIYDIAVDAPHAPKLFAQLVKAAGLTEDARRRISQKAFEESDRDKLFDLLS